MPRKSDMTQSAPESALQSNETRASSTSSSSNTADGPSRKQLQSWAVGTLQEWFEGWTDPTLGTEFMQWKICHEEYTDEGLIFSLQGGRGAPAARSVRGQAQAEAVAVKQKQRLREWAVNVLIAWFHGLNAKGSDVGDPMRVSVQHANSHGFTVAVSKGSAPNRQETIYEVTIQVKKLGKR